MILNASRMWIMAKSLNDAILFSQLSQLSSGECRSSS